ncbi:glycine zipper 2TM domain-containing protein [Diaphorobacter aerolatus]|uniref:glycine zipper 2TM domain-containing protein n=1 Tax=Diaphorobacter aerolatus TaxID=1288495 RepID=UPI00384B44A6
MMNKFVALTVITASASAAVPAFAQQEQGRVLAATPVIQQVAIPQQVCGSDYVYSRRQPTGGGALLGAIVGGLAGSAIGGGSGRAAATAIGAMGGSIVGNQVEAGPPGYYPVQRCGTQTYYENRTVGYDVTYEYAGRRYTTRTDYAPVNGFRCRSNRPLRADTVPMTLMVAPTRSSPTTSTRSNRSNRSSPKATTETTAMTSHRALPTTIATTTTVDTRTTATRAAAAIRSPAPWSRARAAPTARPSPMEISNTATRATSPIVPDATLLVLHGKGAPAAPFSLPPCFGTCRANPEPRRGA